MKKVFIIFAILSLLLAAGGILSAAALSAAKKDRMKESSQNIQIRTDTEPIYNHFPDLPEALEIQWCSQSSRGIGLTTTRLYFFAFYDHDVSSELLGAIQEMTIEDQGESRELYFVPENIDENEKWRKIQSPGDVFLLQTGVRESARFYVDIYMNDTGTILYVEGVGD